MKRADRGEPEKRPQEQPCETPGSCGKGNPDDPSDPRVWRCGPCSARQFGTPPEEPASGGFLKPPRPRPKAKSRQQVKEEMRPEPSAEPACEHGVNYTTVCDECQTPTLIKRPEPEGEPDIRCSPEMQIRSGHLFRKAGGSCILCRPLDDFPIFTPAHVEAACKNATEWMAISKLDDKFEDYKGDFLEDFRTVMAALAGQGE